jgi:formate hydrogenlyase subunit 4
MARPQNSLPRIVVVSVLAVVGIAWVAVYLAAGRNGTSIPWMFDLGNWNWLIGFGLFFVGLTASANPGTPMGRGRGVLVGMLGSFLIGLVWIVLYYVTGSSGQVPLINELGNYNLFVGVAFLAVGFAFATKWE